MSGPIKRIFVGRALRNEKLSGTLLSKRIDKESRKKGKYVLMEKEVFSLFKARRAKGRKVSARWLSTTASIIMKELYPGQAAAFCGSKSWRRRFSMRLILGAERGSADRRAD